MIYDRYNEAQRQVIASVVAHIMYADGELSQGELDRMGSLAEALQLSPDSLPGILGAATGPLDRGMLQALAESLSPRDRAQILRAAVEMALADGHLSDEELKAIREVGSALGVAEWTLAQLCLWGKVGSDWHRAGERILEEA